MCFLKGTVSGEKFERLLWTICSERNAHVLGVKELNIGKIILDMSESLEVCRHSTAYLRDPGREEVR